MEINEAFFRLINDNVRDAIRVIDLKSLTYTYANAYACRLFSEPGKEYVGTSLGPSLPNDEYAKLKDVLMDELQHDAERDPGRSMLMELKEKPPGYNGFIWTENKATFIRDDAGKPVAILTITRDITERKHAEEQIQKSLQEKEILLKEIHHRVKNNLQIVMSLINLQKNRIQDEDIRNLFSQCATRIKAMALIHEMLYHSKELSQIDMKDYATTLVKELKGIYDCRPASTGIELLLARVLLNIDHAVPAALIINELVSNAFKYAFPENFDGKGIITVSMEETENDVEIAVKDNGIGMPADVSMDGGETLGLSLVSMLTQQLRGKLEISRENGTAFRIRFPRN